MSVMCNCGQEDISTMPNSIWAYGNVSHSKLRCVNIVENGSPIVKGMINFVKPHHVENKTNLYGNKWDGGQFEEQPYMMPEAKYTEEDISRVKDESYRNGYGVGYEKGLEKGIFRVRYLSSTYSDYSATKAHVEKSEEYWADGIDPDEP